MVEGGAPASYRSQLIGRREVAERTWAFQFRKPSGYEFTAGQFVDMTLDASPGTDASGLVHAFSLASAPHEDALMVTTRLRETAFKQTLAGMALGAEVTLSAPIGELVLHDDASRPAVILAGGIGITPFRSIVLDATERKLGHRISLFYSNRRPEDAPFLEELRGLGRRNPKFDFIPTMTAMDQSHHLWEGERGRIDLAMVARHARGSETAVHYVAGPPGLVNELHAMLTRSGVAEENIRAETFDGY